MIEQAACEAVQHSSDFKPFVVDGPTTAEVVFLDPSHADTVEQMDFVTRVEGRTIRLEAGDFPKTFELFSALHFLAPVVR